MISKETIIKTSICYWSDDDDCFVVESPLVDITAGVGGTVAEAKTHYAALLDDVYPELKKDNVVGYKGGRPTKPGIQMNALVRPTTKAKIAQIAQKLGISNGETIDFVVHFYLLRGTTEPSLPRKQITIEVPGLTELSPERVAAVVRSALSKPTSRSTKNKEPVAKKGRVTAAKSGREKLTTTAAKSRKRRV